MRTGDGGRAGGWVLRGAGALMDAVRITIPQRLVSFDSALRVQISLSLLKGMRQSFVPRALGSSGPEEGIGHRRGIKPNYFHCFQVPPVIVVFFM